MNNYILCEKPPHCLTARQHLELLSCITELLKNSNSANSTWEKRQICVTKYQMKEGCHRSITWPQTHRKACRLCLQTNKKQPFFVLSLLAASGPDLFSASTDLNAPQRGEEEQEGNPVEVNGGSGAVRLERSQGSALHWHFFLSLSCCLIISPLSPPPAQSGYFCSWCFSASFSPLLLFISLNSLSPLSLRNDWVKNAFLWQSNIS